MLLDKRRLTPRLFIGIVLALLGGILAANADIASANPGIGALLCIVAVILFAWATRATSNDLGDLSAIGRTTVTLFGGMMFMIVSQVVMGLLNHPLSWVGSLGDNNFWWFLIFAVLSLTIAQTLWIIAAKDLGILIASFHVNAVPFYGMVTMLVIFDGIWNSTQALGAGLVCAGVLIAQWTSKPKQ